MKKETIEERLENLKHDLADAFDSYGQRLLAETGFVESAEELGKIINNDPNESIYLNPRIPILVDDIEESLKGFKKAYKLESCLKKIRKFKKQIKKLESEID